MNAKIVLPIVFMMGAGVGSLATIIILREKYQKKLEQETESLIQDFITHRTKHAYQTVVDAKDLDREYPPKPPTYETIIDALGYIPDDESYHPDEDYDEDDDSSDFREDPEPEDIYSDLESRTLSEPCAVSPDEFSELIDNGYSYTQWNIYNGKHNAQVICDENDMIIDHDEMDEQIGKAIYSIGEYDEDILYVRNDRLRCAIEVTRDNRSYEEILRAMPYLEI